MATFARLFLFGFLLLFISNSCWNVSGDEIAIVSHPTTVRLSFAQLLENSQMSKPSTSVLCERVHIRGLSRYRNLVKYAHALKVKVEIPQTSSRVYLQNVEICFHSNVSLGVGMCAKEEWQKLVKGAWVQAISPYENKFLDLRILGGSLEFLEVSTEEEILWHRVTFLALGFVMMTLAPALSESIVMYYSSAMAVGIILVILLVLFQGMKLLPTGRKSSLAIFIYSGVIGAGSFLLRYLSGLLRSVLVKMGISEDMYNPVAIFVLLGLVLVGAWLGFWGVHKFVLTEDGSVDKSVAKFVRCSIWIFSAVMIFQSSLDTHLATQALVSAIAISSLTRNIFESKFLYRLYRFYMVSLGRNTVRKNTRQCTICSLLYFLGFRRCLYKTARRIWRNSQIKYPVPDGSLTEYDYIGKNKRQSSESLRQRTRPYSLSACTSPLKGDHAGLINTPPRGLSNADSYYSSFHNTPERRRFSKEEWETFTRNSTKRALQGLVSSPDFSTWAVANAERITLTPIEDTAHKTKQSRWSWLW